MWTCTATGVSSDAAKRKHDHSSFQGTWNPTDRRRRARQDRPPALVGRYARPDPARELQKRKGKRRRGHRHDGCWRIHGRGRPRARRGGQDGPAVAYLKKCTAFFQDAARIPAGKSTDEKRAALRTWREDRYQKLLDAVYKRRGWNSNGIPTLETARALGIDQVAGLPELLDELDSQQCPWGVVTNKPGYLTDPLLDALALGARVACVVSGDTLPKRKPDPAPLLHACDLAGLLPETTVYIGDASRDIEAGQNAGMATIAAAYGYITPDDDALNWGADLIASDTGELAQIVLKAVNLGA